MKTVSLEDYVRSESYADFAMFFVLSAKDLETMTIKFTSPPAEFMGVFYEKNKGFWSGIEGLLNVHVLDYHQVAAMRVRI